MTRSGPDEPDEPAGAPLPAQLTEKWQQAQDRLFGPLIMQPELYERVVLVLAATMDRLRELTPTTASLIVVQDDVTELVMEQAQLKGLDPVGVDPAMLGQAALALRYREVVSSQSRP